LLGFVAVACCCFYLHVQLRERSKIPQSIELSQAFADKNLVDTYLAISGELHPDHLLEYYTRETKEAPEQLEKLMVPFMDPATRKVLLVQMRDLELRNAFGTFPRTITGTLRAIDPKLQAKLLNDHGKLDGIEVSTDFVLIDGEISEPPKHWWFAGIFSAVLGALIYISLRVGNFQHR
jgi:hypothetical protein